MKKFDLGQTITILANVGVIAGIIFLGLELRQNNELMEAQTRLTTNELGLQFALSLSQNPSLAAILAKVGRDEPLTDAEDIQLYGIGLYVLRALEHTYREMVRGALSETDFDVEGMRAVYHSNRLDYKLDETWESVRAQADPEFAQFFDENVVNRPFE